VTSRETSAPYRAALDSPAAESRWTAARALAGQADAVPALAAALGREPTPRVREAMMTALIRIGNAASIEVILPYLRSQDAGLRAAAIEALQALPEAIAPFMEPLLSDDDSDVRLLATELARNMEASEATRLLCELIEREHHPNVCAAAIDVLRGWNARSAFNAGKVCGALCGNAVSAVCDFGGDEPYIGRRELDQMDDSKGGSSHATHISPEQVQRFCEFVYRRTGMSFTESKRYFIDRRLEDRMAATGSSSFQEYFSLLRTDADHESN
jgi:hypothetical protein